MVNEMKLWKDRVDGELNSAAEWEANWGFLKVVKKDDEPPEGTLLGCTCFIYFSSCKSKSFFIIDVFFFHPE